MEPHIFLVRIVFYVLYATFSLLCSTSGFMYISRICATFISHLYLIIAIIEQSCRSLASANVFVLRFNRL